MPQDPNALVWIDLEMTGLNSNTDSILEIATIITDGGLNIIAQGPVLAVHQPDAVLAAMDEWNRRTHGASGLIERSKQSTLSLADAESATLSFIQQYVPKNKSPLCGNGICQDRRFLARLMPELETWLHYRNLDVSTLKELVSRWRPALANGFEKKNTHKALDDILESIGELKYYREHFLKLS